MKKKDLISRQDVIDAISKLPVKVDDQGYTWMIAIDVLNQIGDIPSVEPERKWIPCSERLPECEQEVLICTKKTVYVSRSSGYTFTEEEIVTPALYEDGTMREVDSKWRWEDIDWAGWDEEEDCGIIPEGWWENRHFNTDEVYNNVVDKEVIAWMPLPEPYKEGK